MGHIAARRLLARLDEPGLIRLAQSGDLDAEDLLLWRCQRWITAEIVRAGIQPALRLEARQAASLAVRRAIRRFDPGRRTQLITPATPYVRWALKSLWRRAALLPSVALTADDGSLIIDVGAEDPTPLTWGVGWVADAVASLPPGHQRYLELEFWYGYGRTEIAAMYEVSPAAVTQQFKRILATLRTHAPDDAASG
jgi:DNA-directed RNA polymerase specialized sigma subunit